MPVVLPPVPPASCANCRYWSAYSGVMDGAGECRRRSPCVALPHWPVTAGEAWCGEHEPAIPAPSAAYTASPELIEHAAAGRLPSNDELHRVRAFRGEATGRVLIVAASEVVAKYTARKLDMGDADYVGTGAKVAGRVYAGVVYLRGWADDSGTAFAWREKAVRSHCASKETPELYL